jgi:hypothetical protein
MVTPLPHLGADSFLLQQGPPTIIQVKTPGGMSLNLSPPPCLSQACLWDSNFLLLQQFRDREGHLKVPKQHVEDGRKLGIWSCMQRTQKRKGTLPSERDRRLNEIGFIWDGWQGHFDLMFRALTQFKEREGHCNVSYTHIGHLDGGVKLKLGRWLSKQRYLQRRGTLDAKKEKRFESLGVTWNNKNHEFAVEQFDRNFDLLLAFQEREGHVRVPIKHQESGKDNLGNWLKEQRSRYRRGLLELDRQKWLETAGVTWEKRIGS